MNIFSHETRTLVLLSAFSIALVVLRILHTGHITYIFLVWNLLLAAIPYWLSKWVSYDSRKSSRLIFNTTVVGSWLLFFPNAPYIFTDLFHLKGTTSSLIWLDTVIILSFAWTGMLLGFLSILRIEVLFLRHWTPFLSQLIISAMLFLSAFGVYIGRYLRFNSWDILTAPQSLIFEITHRVANPLMHPRTWGMTLIFGLFLNLIFYSFKVLHKPLIEDNQKNM